MRVIGIFGVHRTPTSRIHEQSIQTFSIHHRISIIFIYTHLKIKMENTYIFESQEEMAEFNNIQDLATAETYLYDNSISQKLSTKRKQFSPAIIGFRHLFRNTRKIPIHLFVSLDEKLSSIQLLIEILALYRHQWIQAFIQKCQKHSHTPTRELKLKTLLHSASNRNLVPNYQQLLSPDAEDQIRPRLIGSKSRQHLAWAILSRRLQKFLGTRGLKYTKSRKTALS